MQLVRFAIGVMGLCLVAFCATNENPKGCPFKLGAVGVVFGLAAAIGSLVAMVDADYDKMIKQIRGGK